MRSTSERSPGHTLADQLQTLAKRAQEQPNARTYLNDPETGISAYVRHGRRSIGTPSGGWLAFVGGELVLETIDCLDIASIDHSDGTEPVDLGAFINFMETIHRLNPWQAVCFDNIADDQLTDWCAENGWSREKPDSNNKNVYKLLPRGRNTLEGVVLSSSSEPLGQLALGSAEATIPPSTQ